MSNPVTPQFEELHEHHVAIATQLVSVVSEDQPGWDRCRLMVQWFIEGGDLASYSFSVRAVSDGRMECSVRWPREHRKTVNEFYEKFQELTGERLARFRITVDAEGKFDVDYFYTEVEALETWLWPDEGGYLTHAELKAKHFILPESC